MENIPTCIIMVRFVWPYCTFKIEFSSTGSTISMDRQNIDYKSTHDAMYIMR